MHPFTSASEPASTVDVSVVIICYNDAANLGAAVNSVLDQTLRNLEVIISDDHSTDSTPEVARSFCEADSRVRYHRLNANSGGCGAPRNQGTDLATGKYVMYLDSDDVLERHACKNLLLEAERSGSDIVSGLTRRVHIGEPEKPTFPWYGWLYLERIHISSLTDYPALVHDTVATNKLYRRKFLADSGTRFPENIHYEDLVFSAQALTRASGISIIPETVYFWNVYPHELRRSITNQRHTDKNLQDRLKAAETALAVFEPLGSEVLTEAYRKFLNHHVRLYLNDLLAIEDEPTAFKVLNAIVAYLQRLPASAFDALQHRERLLYASVLEMDLSATRRQVQSLQSGAISGNIYRDGSQCFWAPRDPDSRPSSTPLSRALSDLSTSHLGSQVHSQVAYSHIVESATLSSSGIQLSVVSTDPLGKLRSNSPALQVLLRSNTGVSASNITKDFIPTSDGVKWVVTMPLPSRRSLRENQGRFFHVESVLSGGSRNDSPLRFTEDAFNAFPRTLDSSFIGRLFRDTWEIRRLPGGREVMEISPSNHGLRVRKLIKMGASLLPRSSFFHQLIQGRRTTHFRTITERIYPILRRLPIDQSRALFEANLGKSAYDNPRAIYNELKSRRPDLTIVWAYNGDPKVAAELQGVPLVRRDSLAYLRELARCKFLVDNQSFPGYFVKRNGQRYLQTWHGIPLKKMGFDLLSSHSKAERARITSAVAAWDGLVVPSPYFEEVFVPAYGFNGSLIKFGTPRNDDLVARGKASAAIIKKLDLPPGRKIILYAPTFRASALGRGRAEELLIDLEQWAQEFGQETVLLIRSHYLNRFAIPEKFRGLCVDVSDYGDVTDLYAIADVLITDYSSVMFDYSNLDRPIVIFAPDYSQYVDQSRGTYFSLLETPPGPFTETMDELAHAIRGLLDFPSKTHKELTKFRELYCAPEDGNASKRAVDFLLQETGE